MSSPARAKPEEPTPMADEFWQLHDRQTFTPVCNSFLDSLITDTRLPLLPRVLAWVLRNSWGRHSVACVNAAGTRQRQADCSRDLKLNSQRLNYVFQELASLHIIRLEEGDILPVDNPAKAGGAL